MRTLFWSCRLPLFVGVFPPAKGLLKFGWGPVVADGWTRGAAVC